MHKHIEALNSDTELYIEHVKILGSSEILLAQNTFEYRQNALQPRDDENLKLGTNKYIASREDVNRVQMQCDIKNRL